MWTTTRGTWTNKNIALLEPTSSCDDPPAGSQDEWAVSVFKVTGNEACGDECVHFSGLVSGASDNFVARKEGSFLCQLFVESHTFPDQARRSLRRRLAPTPLMTNMHMRPTARQPAFAPVPDIDLTASWLVAAAGICSDLSVTPKSEMVAAKSDADQSGTFVADISFKFHPATSVAFAKSPDHGAVEIGDDGIVIREKAYSATDVLSAAVWDLKNIALVEPTSSCDDPPTGSQDEWGVSVFKVTGNDECGESCVRYGGHVSAASSNLVRLEKSGRFPCQLYVDASEASCKGIGEDCGGAYGKAHDDECCSKYCSIYSNTCYWDGEDGISHASPSPPPPPPVPAPLEAKAATPICPSVSFCEPLEWTELGFTDVPVGTCDPNPESSGSQTVVCPPGTVLMPPQGGKPTTTPPKFLGSYNDYGASTQVKGQRIKVISATYGGSASEWGGSNCGSSDQTANLADYCDGKEQCAYPINYQDIGDPSVGCTKKYSSLLLVWRRVEHQVLRRSASGGERQDSDSQVPLHRLVPASPTARMRS